MEFYSGQPDILAASVRDYCTGVLIAAGTFLILFEKTAQTLFKALQLVPDWRLTALITRWCCIVQILLDRIT